MDKLLKTKKNPKGKWWTYGKLVTNQWGKEQVTFRIDYLQQLLDDSRAIDATWVNLSIFEEEKPNKRTEHRPLNDEIPF